MYLYSFNQSKQTTLLTHYERIALPLYLWHGAILLRKIYH